MPSNVRRTVLIVELHQHEQAGFKILACLEVHSSVLVVVIKL